MGIGSVNDQDFSSSIAGLSDAGGLKSKGDGSGFVAAARRQAQMHVGGFAYTTHQRLMESAAFLSFTGFALWGDAGNDPTYEQDQVA